MSAEMSTSNGEPFKVVQKRSSNQGRRAVSGSRERYSDRYGYGRQGGTGPRHSGGHTPNSEEPSTVTRKKTPLHLLHQRVGDKADREIKLRPQTGRSGTGSSRSGASSGSSVGGGSGRDSSSESFHHTGRHRTSSNSMDSESGKTSKAEKSITSPNRFEKLENLDPDVDDSVLEPSSSSEALKVLSSSKSAEPERKQRDRERSTGGGGGGGSTSSSTTNHRGRKGNVVYQHNRGGKGHSNDPEMPGKSKSSEGNRNTGINEQDSEHETSKDRLNRSETKRTSSYDSGKSLDNDSEMNDTSVSLKNASSSTSGIEAGPSHESLSCPEEQLELSQEERERRMAERISYSREELLALKKHPLSQRKPKLLIWDSVIVNGSFSDAESAFEEVRLKPLTPFSFLRDQESKQFSGSQRRGSDSSSRQYEREGSSRSLSKSSRESRGDWRQQRGSRHDSRYYQEVEEEPEPEWMEFGPTDRFDVIELKGFDKDELEREAHGERAKSEEKTSEDKSVPAWEEEIVAENRDEGTGREEEEEQGEKERGKVKEETAQLRREKGPGGGNEYILDGFDFSTGLSICAELALDEDDGERSAEDHDPVSSLLHEAEVQTPVQLSNVLMKALKVGGGERAESASAVKNQEIKSTRPVNALTLDEIHARENIHPVDEPSDKGSNDLGAFNKLVAVLQSSGDIKNEKGSPPPPPSSKVEPQQLPPQQLNQRQLPTQAPPTRVAPAPYVDPRLKSGLDHNSSPTEMVNTNFGSLLEKELGFDEEGPTPMMKGPPPVIPSHSMAPPYQPPTLPPSHAQQREYPPTPSQRPPPPPTNLISRGEPQATPQPSMSRLEVIAGMLEKLDRSHLHTTNYDIAPNPVPPPNVKMRMEQQQRQQLAAMQMERERERERERAAGWRYPEAFVDQPHMTPSPELLRSMPPPPRQLPGVGGRLMGPPPSSGRPNSNHWAVEMERRRLFELQQIQMRERERLFQRHQQQQQQHGMSPTAQGKAMPPGPGSKPNISLLPTSVMRHIHNTKPNHQLSEMTKTSAASNMPVRMDQVQHSHPGMRNHSAESAPTMDYPPTSHPMVSAAPESHAHSNAAMMYPHYTSMPQRMSSQHNPPYWY